MAPRRLFAALFLSGALVLASSGSGSADVGWKWVTANGIVIAVPMYWSAMPYGPWCMRNEGGVLVTSIRRQWQHETIRNGCSTGRAFPHIPSSFRGVDVQRFAFPFGSQPDTKLPVEVPSHRCCSHPARGSTVVWHNRVGYVVTAYWGLRVPKHDRILTSVIRSIHFTP
jgi:hypothetical protein